MMKKTKVNVSRYGVKLVKESGTRYEIKKQINSPETALDFAEKVLELDQLCEEFVYMAALDTKNNVIGYFEVSHGNLNSSLIHPREIFKRAILSNAASIMLFHNHPSGNPKASPEDIKVTRMIEEAGKIMGIPLLDHIIVGESGYTSLKKEGEVL